MGKHLVDPAGKGLGRRWNFLSDTVVQQFVDVPITRRCLGQLYLSRLKIVLLNKLFDGNPGTFFQIQQRSEEHTSELQSLMRNSYAVFCLQKKKKKKKNPIKT